MDQKAEAGAGKTTSRCVSVIDVGRKRMPHHAWVWLQLAQISLPTRDHVVSDGWGRCLMPPNVTIGTKAIMADPEAAK